MFDYIVVGAGTAGCTLAARLTEDASAHVLLIEAGPPGRRRELSTPAAFPALQGSDLDWRDATEPQANLNGRRLAWPRGKVLGGSGAIGAMIHLRGCRADYDAWRDLGNPGWGFDDLAPLWVDPPLTANLTPPDRLTEVFLDASGAKPDSVLRSPEHEGSGLFPVARVNGARWDATGAFLQPALKRGNLTVWTGVHVAKILIENGRAMGVEYLLKGSRNEARASQEVILCVGATGSAQLLLLSGIGPAEQLESFGIPVAVALPGVGANLQDHVAAPLHWICPQPVSLDGTGTVRNWLQYRWNRQGPFASNLIEAGAFFKSSPALPACDLEIMFTPLYAPQRGLALPAEHHGFTLLAALVAPASRGQITLASADPLQAPRIDPCYLTEAEDEARLMLVVDRARTIAAAAAFAPFRGEPSGSTTDASDIEEHAVSLNHSAGTCRMGPDENSVVDAELRVRGIDGLRVADASVIPVLPRAHPNATVMVIAQKAAQLIKAG